MSIRSEDTQPLVVYWLSLAFGMDHFPISFSFSLVPGRYHVDVSMCLCVSFVPC